MSSPHRQLSSLVSLPKTLGDSLAASLSPAAAESSEVRLAPRPVYPINLAVEAEGLQQVGSEILWRDIASQHCQGSNPCFSSREQPICVWVGDGNLATVADACITIKLVLQPVPSNSSRQSIAPRRRRKATWRQWLTCQDLQVDEPLLNLLDNPNTLHQEGAAPQELAQETILLQEVLLTAHMARAYEFPTVVGGTLKVEVVIGTPQRGPYHLSLRQANPGTLFTDHNEDDVFAVLPLPPRMRKQRGLPPKGPSSPRPSLQGRIGLSDHSRRSVSFKHGNCDNKIGILASGTSKDVVADATFQPARRSASRKQLQFAPIQLGRVSEQPQKSAAAQGFEDELMSPGRSKSLGSAVDRALLKSAVDSELAVSKDRPHSATQFSRQVHMQNVTVYADEHAALQLVSQGSITKTARRVSRSKQEPLEVVERRRSHSRASTPSAKDMQTGAPSLDFQIMHLAGGSQGGCLSRCVQDDQGLCISTRNQAGAWMVWAHLVFSLDSGRPLQLQDIQIILAGSPTASNRDSEAAAAAPNPLAAGRFQLSNRQQSTFQGSQPLVAAPAHQWSWSSIAASGAAADAASASAVAPQQVPSTSNTEKDAPILDKQEASCAEGKKKTVPKDSQAAAKTGAATSGRPSSSSSAQQSGTSSSSCEGGLVGMACIAVRPVESSLHPQPSLAATKQLGSRGGSRTGSKGGSRAGSRSNSRRNLIVPQLSSAGQLLPSEPLSDRCEWYSRRRVTGDDAGWRGRATDDSSISGTSRKEPCPMALWFHEACADQAAALACLGYALYALTHTTSMPLQWSVAESGHNLD